MMTLGMRFKQIAFLRNAGAMLCGALLWAGMLLVAAALVACSNDANSLGGDQDNKEILVSQTKALTSKDALNQTESRDLIQYQMPTYIGGDRVEQEALYQTLKNNTALSRLEKKQWLLLQLSLFATDKEQTLTKLETITDALALASEQSANDGAQDYELMAALGSALSYQSVFYQNDLGSMNLLSRKGMRYMDRAIKKAPNHLGIRLLRGISYANMPAFLNRASFAVTDLTLLKEGVLDKSKTKDKVVKKQSLKKQSKYFIEFINYYLALAYAKNAQLEAAKTLWQTLENNPDSEWASLASSRLKEV